MGWTSGYVNRRATRTGKDRIMCSYKAGIAWGLALSGLFVVCGCGGRGASSAKSSPVPEAKSAIEATSAAPTTPSSAETMDEHGHKAGAHGGIMISLGRDSYHAEAVFEQGGVLRIYTLGKEESRVIDVEIQTLKGFVKAEGDAEARQFSLEAEPQAGDAEGRTSQFVGVLPTGLSGRNLEVTVPNIVISGERFRLGFKSTSEQHDDPMPDKIADDEEQRLYLTPGGLYTAEDIQANGGLTATVKFQGVKSAHDMFPKPGDKICPVTKTKANPKFAWVVGGNKYEFCCPPCVDEFVKTAKATPEEIKQPADYVKK